MGKYDPLKMFLKAQSDEVVPMTFTEIEKVLGTKLPASKSHRAWWSNNPDNNVMTRGWLDAGYETEAVDIAGERLVFRRVRDSEHGTLRSGFAEERQLPLKEVKRPIHPGFGFMKGLITIEEGFDVTGPFDDEPWDQGYLGEERRQ